jgi:site-specific DNA recombinase
MRAVAYARVSTLDQASEEKVSIPDQLKWAENIAKEKGWEYGEPIIEPGIKGYAELEDREGVTKLFNDAKQDRFDIVLVYHSSRIAREGDLILKFHRILANSKVQVFIRNIPAEIVKKEDYYWGGNYTQQIMTALAGVQDQQENVARSERVRSGFRGMAERGKLVFAPYGYEKKYSVDVNGKRTWTWEVDTNKAIVVEIIFDGYGNKEMTIRGLMMYLNEEKKIPSPSGSQWSSSTVKNILSNPAYIGKVRWGRKLGSRYKQGTSSTGKQKRIILTPDKWVLENGDQPSIIGDELFNKVQTRLRERGLIHGRTIASPGLLTGLVKCGICGKNAYHKAQRIKRKGDLEKKGVRFDYICQTYVSKGKNACRRHIMSASKLHELVIEDINKVISSASKRNKIFYTGTSNNLSKLEEKRLNYVTAIKKLEIESGRVVEAFSKGAITLDDLGRERKRIDNDTIAIQKELDSIEDKVKKIDQSQNAKEKLKNIAKDFKKAFKKGSFINQKELIHSLLESVVVEKDGAVTINYKL